MKDVKPIILRNEDTGNEYTLEFNRDAVAFAERNGFDPDEVAKYPVTRLPELFYYAFRMHHKNISRADANRILFDELGGIPNGMAERLLQLYYAGYETLVQPEDEAARPTKMTVTL